MHKKLLPPELLRLAQICTKSFVGWGFAPDPTGGAYSAVSSPSVWGKAPADKLLPDPLARLGNGAPGEREGGREGEKEGGGKGGRGRSPGMPKSRVGKPTPHF